MVGMPNAAIASPQRYSRMDERSTAQAVAEARVRRLARALELDVPEFAALRLRTWPDHQGAAVAQLPGPMAELMAGIDHRQRLEAFQRLVTGHGLGESRIGENRPDQDRSAPLRHGLACSRCGRTPTFSAGMAVKNWPPSRAK